MHFIILSRAKWAMLLPLLVTPVVAVTLEQQESTCKNRADLACAATGIDESLMQDSLSMLQTSLHLSPSTSPPSRAPAPAPPVTRVLGGVYQAFIENAVHRGDKDCAPLTQPTSIDRKRVLIATPVKDASTRLREYAKSIARLSYNKALVSVAFLVSDSHDGTAELATELASQSLAEFANVSVIIENFNYTGSGDRHAHEAQGARRTILAKSRNALLQHSLTQDIDYVLWLDVDVTDFPDTLVQDLIAIGRPIVAPHVLIGDTTYDKNSWRERFPHKTLSGIANEVFFEAYAVQENGHRDHMDFLQKVAQRRGIKDWWYAVRLDAVGTAALLVDAKLHRDVGLLFPETPYKHRLESEGFGLLARDNGFHACGLPLYKVRHFDEWRFEHDQKIREQFERTSKEERTRFKEKKAELMKKAEKVEGRYKAEKMKKAAKVESGKMEKMQSKMGPIEEGIAEAFGTPPEERLQATLGGVNP